jgi:drug/metabolite transporter (DMT)-like permease
MRDLAAPAAILPQRCREVAAAVSSRKTPTLGLVLMAFAAVYVIWGSTYLGIHVAIQSIPPFLMAGGRAVLAGGMLYVVMRLRGEARPARIHWINATIVGGLLLAAEMAE